MHFRYLAAAVIAAIGIMSAPASADVFSQTRTGIMDGSASVSTDGPGRNNADLNLGAAVTRPGPIKLNGTASANGSRTAGAKADIIGGVQLIASIGTQRTGGDAKVESRSISYDFSAAGAAVGRDRSVTVRGAADAAMGVRGNIDNTTRTGGASASVRASASDRTAASVAGNASVSETLGRAKNN